MQLQRNRNSVESKSTLHICGFSVSSLIYGFSSLTKRSPFEFYTAMPVTVHNSLVFCQRVHKTCLVEPFPVWCCNQSHTPHIGTVLMCRFILLTHSRISNSHFLIILTFSKMSGNFQTNNRKQDSDTLLLICEGKLVTTLKWQKRLQFGIDWCGLKMMPFSVFHRIFFKMSSNQNTKERERCGPLVMMSLF